jgi:hypothetical protein
MNNPKLKSKPKTIGKPKPERSSGGATGSATPRTDAAAKRSLDILTACKSADDFNGAVKQMTSDLLSTSKELEKRVVELETHLRAVCGLTVESGNKKIVETMNAAEAAITPNDQAH